MTFNNALAETIIGLYKPKLTTDAVPKRYVEHVEFATLEYGSIGSSSSSGIVSSRPKPWWLDSVRLTLRSAWSLISASPEYAERTRSRRVSKPPILLN